MKKILSILNRKKTVGLYISQHTVDIVVLKGALKGPRLIKFGQTSIYPDGKEEIIPESVDGAALENHGPQPNAKKKDDYITEAIQRVFKENNIKPENVIVAIPSEDVMVRYFQIPKIPRQELTSAINFEAKRYIPFRIDDVTADFQVIHRKSATDSMDVIFVAVRQKTLERFARLLEVAGVRPMAIEPAPFSFIRAFSEAEQISDTINMALVYIDTKSANINLLRHGIPYIIRDIPFEEPASEEGPLEPMFDKLLSEMKLSFDFYEKQFPNETIDKILIYSNVPLGDWHGLVGRELQIEVEIGDPFRGVRIKKDVIPPRMAICFGLALRGISAPFINVNLYKEKMLVYKRKELFLKMVFLEASAAVFLLIILRLFCIKALAPLANELKTTLSERPKIEVDIKETGIEELERIKNEVEAKDLLLENIISRRTFFTPILMDLSKFVSDNLWLTDLSFEEVVDKKNASKVSRSLNIKGYCIIEEGVNETDAINNFLLDLKEGAFLNKEMAKADIASVQKTEVAGEKVVSFEIVFTGP